MSIGKKSLNKSTILVSKIALMLVYTILLIWWRSTIPNDLGSMVMSFYLLFVVIVITPILTVVLFHYEKKWITVLLSSVTTIVVFVTILIMSNLFYAHR